MVDLMRKSNKNFIYKYRRAKLVKYGITNNRTLLIHTDWAVGNNSALILEMKDKTDRNDQLLGLLEVSSRKK